MGSSETLRHRGMRLPLLCCGWIKKGGGGAFLLDFPLALAAYTT